MTTNNGTQKVGLVPTYLQDNEVFLPNDVNSKFVSLDEEEDAIAASYDELHTVNGGARTEKLEDLIYTNKKGFKALRPGVPLTQAEGDRLRGSISKFNRRRKRIVDAQPDSYNGRGRTTAKWGFVARGHYYYVDHNEPLYHKQWRLAHEKKPTHHPPPKAFPQYVPPCEKPSMVGKKAETVYYPDEPSRDPNHSKVPNYPFPKEVTSSQYFIDFPVFQNMYGECCQEVARRKHYYVSANGPLVWLVETYDPDNWSSDHFRLALDKARLTVEKRPNDPNVSSRYYEVTNSSLLYRFLPHLKKKHDDLLKVIASKKSPNAYALIYNSAAVLIIGQRGGHGFAPKIRKDLVERADITLHRRSFVPESVTDSTLWDHIAYEISACAVTGITTVIGPLASWWHGVSQASQLEKHPKRCAELCEHLRSFEHLPHDEALAGLNQWLLWRKPRYRFQIKEFPSISKPKLRYQSGVVDDGNLLRFQSGSAVQLGVRMFDLTALVFGLRSATTIPQVGIFLYQYGRTFMDINTLTTLIDYLEGSKKIYLPKFEHQQWLDDRSESSESTIEFYPPSDDESVYNQNGLEEKDLLSNLFEKTLLFFETTELGGRLAKVLSCFSIMGVLGSLEIGGDTVTWFRRSSLLHHLLADKKGKESTFFSFLTELVSFVVNALSETVKTGDISYLFGAKMSTHSWHSWASVLLDSPEICSIPASEAATKLFQSRLKEGRYPKNITTQLLPEEYVCQLEDCLRQGDKVLVSNDPNSPLGVKILTMCNRLMSEIKRLERIKIDASERRQPFGVFIPGAPGIGKSTFTNLLHKRLGLAFDLGTGSDSIFNVDLTQNFPVYHPNQWFAWADDIDATADPKATTASGMNHCSSVIKYINIAPQNMEGAAIGSKGTLYANFMAFVYCTNYANGRLKGFTSQPIAWWRRFPYRVDLDVYPVYMTNGALDVSKVPEGIEDIWCNITISKYDYGAYNSALPFESIPYVVVAEFSHLSEALNFLADRAVEFTTTQENKLKMTMSGDRCPKCNCLAHSHPEEVFCQSEITAAYVTYAIWMLLLSGYVYHWCDTITDGVEYGYHAIRAFDCRINNELTQFKSLVSITLRRWKRHFIKIGLTIAAIASGLAMVSMAKYMHRASLKYESTLVGESNVSNAFPANAAWKRVPIQASRPYTTLKQPTWTRDDLFLFLRRTIAVFKYNGRKTYGMHYSKRVFVVPLHLFSSTPQGRSTNVLYGQKLTVEMDTLYAEVEITEDIFEVVPNRDAVLVYLPAMGSTLSLADRLPQSSQAAHQIKADLAHMVYPSEIRTLPHCEAVTKYGNQTAKNYVWCYQGATEDGDCGLPIVGTFGHNFTVVGYHVATSSSHRFGENLCRDDLDPALHRLFDKQAVVPAEIRHQAQDFEEKKIWEFKDLPSKSSLWAHLSGSHPVSTMVGGTIVGHHNSTFKHSIEPMPDREIWDDWSIELTGVKDYYVGATVKGEMVGEDWIDPYVVNLNQADNIGGDLRVWSSAVKDYLTGFENLIGRDKARPFTLHEVILGIPGTDVGGIDLSTSCGQPFNCPKNRHFRLDHTERTVEISPEMQDQLDTEMYYLRKGYAYAPVCSHVPKNEAITYLKEADHKTRIFNVLPASFNLLLKQYLGPVMMFARRHPLFFETAIGMNVTSAQWQELHDWLDVYPHWSACDNSSFDMKQSTYEGLAVVDCLLQMCRMLHYTEEELTIVNGLLQGCIYTTRVIKGDVFFLSYTMATGFWLTILVNTIRNCLQRRYAFIRCRPNSDLLFRDGVRQITLGDDNLMTTRWPWYNQRVIQAVLREVGAQITDAQKRLVVPEFELKSEATFLKRFMVEKDGMCLCPIEKKALLRMVTVMTRSKVSRNDHLAQIYSNVMAESWMHGREFFDFMEEKILGIITKYRIQSPDLRIYSYDRYVEKFREGNLCIWDSSQNDLEGFVLPPLESFNSD